MIEALEQIWAWESALPPPVFGTLNKSLTLLKPVSLPINGIILGLED